MSKLKSKKVAGIFGAALLAAGLAVGLGVKLPSAASSSIAPGEYVVVGIGYNLSTKSFEVDLMSCAIDGSPITGSEIGNVAFYEGSGMPTLKELIDAYCKPVGTLALSPEEAGEHSVLSQYIVK